MSGFEPGRAGQTGLCSARTSVNSNRVGHTLYGLCGLERSLDAAIGRIDDATFPSGAFAFLAHPRYDWFLLEVS